MNALTDVGNKIRPAPSSSDGRSSLSGPSSMFDETSRSVRNAGKGQSNTFPLRLVSIVRSIGLLLPGELLLELSILCKKGDEVFLV